MSQTAETTRAPARRRGCPWGRALLLVVILALAYGVGILVAPYIPATQFEAPLKEALERTLDRKVELSDVRFSLYPSPGLSAQNLVIHDSATFGLEPLAYVSEIQVGLRWASLLRGRFEYSSVLLDEASLNLARTGDGGWNFGAFLWQMTHNLQRDARAPKLQVRNGRINFRDGLRKSAFFLNSVDLDLNTPSSADGEFGWSYEASPARTDRSAQGFGRFSGSGRWRPAGGEKGILDLDLELERSVISEVAVLLTGRDPGVQGRLSSRAHLSGSPDNIQVRGSLRLGDLQKPSLFGVGGREWSIPYAGVLNLETQAVEVGTAPLKDTAGLPLSFRFTAGGLFSRIAWQARFLFDGFPAPTLLEIAGRLGAQVPPGLGVEGTLEGPLDFSSSTAAQGTIELHDGRLRFGETPPYQVESARFSVNGSTLSLDTATVLGATAGAAQASGEWDLSSGAVSVESSLNDVRWKDLRTAFDALPELRLPPGLSACQDGELEGDLRLERLAQGAEGMVPAGGPARGSAPETRWTGTLRLTGFECAIEGAAEPVRLERGTLAIAGPAWHLRRASGRIGRIVWSGEMYWQPPAAQPVRFTLSVDDLSATEVERVFRPVLGLRSGLLERTLAFRQVPAPPWLAARRWDGRVAIGTLNLAGYSISKLNGHVLWTGDSIDVAEVQARLSGGRIFGRGFIHLGAAEPRYRLRGFLDALEWEGHGSVDGEFDLSANGFGDDLRDTLRCTGELTSRRLDLAEETLDKVSLGFDYDSSRAGQRLRLTGIEAEEDGAPLLGSGGSSGDGRWRAEITAGSRTLRLSGTFLPLRLDSEGGNQAHER